MAEPYYDAVQLLMDVGCPADKIRHSQDVALIALEVAGACERSGCSVDKAIIGQGALLHDIGIALTGDDLSPEHCALGANLLRERGYPESVARCVERHEMGGLTREEASIFKFPLPLQETYVPETLEERVVAFADLMLFAVVEEDLDPWADPKAAERALRGYVEECFRKATRNIPPPDFGVYERANRLAAEMLRYLPRTTFVRLGLTHDRTEPHP